MIRFILCLMCMQMGTMGYTPWTPRFKIDYRKEYKSGHVCNYEVKNASSVKFLLYTCVPSSMCKKVDFKTKYQRDPEIYVDNCNGTFLPRPDGDPYVCCHPADNLENPQNGSLEVDSVPSTTDWMPGFRSALKCKDYGQLVCLDRSNCPGISRRIVKGGRQTTIGKYPHLAAVGHHYNATSVEYMELKRKKDDTTTEEWFCLGSIISEDFVLTAASCYSDLKGKRSINATYGILTKLMVRVGETELCRLEEGCPLPKYAQRIPVEDRIRHPSYNPEYFYHDIMLLKLSTKITFNPLVRPACLMDDFNLFEGGGLFAVYEEEKENGEFVNSTHEMELQIFSEIACLNYGYHFDVRLDEGWYDKNIQFCAGLPALDITPCELDYGGPLTIRRQSPFCAWWVYGVMGYSSHFWCKSTATPMFTRVAFYIDWIEKIVWPSFDLFHEYNTSKSRCKDAQRPPQLRPGICPSYVTPYNSSSFC